MTKLMKRMMPDLFILSRCYGEGVGGDYLLTDMQNKIQGHGMLFTLCILCMVVKYIVAYVIVNVFDNHTQCTEVDILDHALLPLVIAQVWQPSRDTFTASAKNFAWKLCKRALSC